MQVAGVLRKFLTTLIFCLGCGSIFFASAQTTPAPQTNTTSKAKPAAVKSQASSSDSATATKAKTASPDVEADTIVAVVNKDVITQRELSVRFQQAKNELRQKGQTPPDDLLMRDVLQRLIQERLEKQEAKRLKIDVTDAMVQKAIDSIAQRNNLTGTQVRKQIEASGMSWDQYREMIRREVMLEGLRQRTVDGTVLISDAEVDAFLRDQKARQTGGLAAIAQQNAPPPVQQAAPARPAPQARPNQPAILGLGQILIRVPEGSSDDQVKALRDRAQDALTRIKRGESFEKVAQAVSEGPEASRGGDMGARPFEGWPDLFLKAVANVKDGQVSGIIQSGNGFHILKVMGRAGGAQSAPQAAPAQAPVAAAGPVGARGNPGAQSGARQGPMPVEQTKAKHILIKTSQVVSDEIAQQKLAQIRERLVEGKESFADLARRFSNDSSAPQGGDLGWLNPGETVPPFEKAMNNLKVGEISQPVKSQFGWHLIVVDDRRTQDMAEQFERNQVRQRLFMQRSEAAFELWLQQIRNQSYIDNRLEKRLNQAKE
ncbi:MAG: peptidylprolyl isomerase [Sheuella sp.]|nr:peptidylprolyl isomerase [Sheuella sp.]